VVVADQKMAGESTEASPAGFLDSLLYLFASHRLSVTSNYFLYCRPAYSEG
jgi:hypothetical protein